MIFVIPACSKYLDVKPIIFYKQVAISLFSSLLIVLFGYTVKMMFNLNSWLNLIVCALVIGVGGLVINAFLTLNKEERQFLIDKVSKKLKFAK